MFTRLFFLVTDFSCVAVQNIVVVLFSTSNFFLINFFLSPNYHILNIYLFLLASMQSLFSLENLINSSPQPVSVAHRLMPDDSMTSRLRRSRFEWFKSSRCPDGEARSNQSSLLRSHSATPRQQTLRPPRCAAVTEILLEFKWVNKTWGERPEYSVQFYREAPKKKKRCFTNTSTISSSFSQVALRRQK